MTCTPVSGQWVVLTPEEAAIDAAQTALFENYKPEEDPDCKDHQYDVRESTTV